MHGMCHSFECPSQICVFPGEEGGWVLESGVWRVDPGRGQLLLVRKEPGAVRRRGFTAGRIGGGAWATLEARSIVKWQANGRATIPHWPSLHGQRQGHTPKQDQPPLKPGSALPAQALGSLLAPWAWAPLLPKPLLTTRVSGLSPAPARDSQG